MVLELRSSGNYFKTRYLLCKSVCIGGLILLFLKMGCGGHMVCQCLTLLGEGYLLFPSTCFLCYKSSIINLSKQTCECFEP
jgi:hypothetical protein